MGKKKNSNQKPHPQKSFEQYVADATLNKFGGYIDAQIQELAQVYLRQSAHQLQILTYRLLALEEVLVEKLGVTKAELAESVARLEDDAEGYKAVTTGVEPGDRVRIQFSSKMSETEEYKGAPANFLVNAVGAGQTLGKDVETSLIGLLPGETRELVIGKEGEVTVKMTVNRISRRPQAEAAPQPEPTQEAPSESVNAG